MSKDINDLLDIVANKENSTSEPDEPEVVEDDRPVIIVPSTFDEYYEMFH